MAQCLARRRWHWQRGHSQTSCHWSAGRTLARILLRGEKGLWNEKWEGNKGSKERISQEFKSGQKIYFSPFSGLSVCCGELSRSSEVEIFSTSHWYSTETLRGTWAHTSRERRTRRRGGRYNITEDQDRHRLIWRRWCLHKQTFRKLTIRIGIQ